MWSTSLYTSAVWFLLYWINSRFTFMRETSPNPLVKPCSKQIGFFRWSWLSALWSLQTAVIMCMFLWGNWENISPAVIVIVLIPWLFSHLHMFRFFFSESWLNPGIRPFLWSSALLLHTVRQLGFLFIYFFPGQGWFCWYVLVIETHKVWIKCVYILELKLL